MPAAIPITPATIHKAKPALKPEDATPFAVANIIVPSIINIPEKERMCFKSYYKQKQKQKYIILNRTYLVYALRAYYGPLANSCPLCIFESKTA